MAGNEHSKSMDNHLDVLSSLFKQMDKCSPDSLQYRECVVLHLELMLTSLDRTEARVLEPDVAVQLAVISQEKVTAYRQSLEAARERLRSMIEQVRRGEVMEAIDRLADHIHQSHMAFLDFMELFEQGEEFGSN
jgi:hypothetical protein